MKVNIIFTLDENFVLPAAVSIFSCLEHLNVDASLDLRLVDGGVTPKSRERLLKIAKKAAGDRKINLQWVKADQSNLPNLENYEFRNSKFNRSNTLRYALESVVTKDCEVAIFLDCDIVLQADILEMADFIHEKPICAVRDYTIPNFAIRFTKGLPGWLSHCEGSMYFNSGVFIADMNYWRVHAISRQLCQYIETNPETCRWPGQDPFNFTFAHNWQEVDLGYNLQTGAPDRLRRLGADEREFLGESYESIRNRAKLIHFTGNKPWNQGLTNPDRPAWTKALESSGWLTPTQLYCWKMNWWRKLLQRGVKKSISRTVPK